MAEEILIKIKTQANSSALKEVNKSLRDLSSSAKALHKELGALVSLQTQLAGASAKTAAATAKAAGATKQQAQANKQAGDSMSKAQRDALSYAQALARLQQSQGKGSQAVETLKKALAGIDQTSKPAIRALTQLEMVSNRLSNNKGPFTLPRTIDGLSGSALRAAKTLGAVSVALMGLNGAAAAISVAADFEGSLNELQAVAGASADQIALVSEKAQALGADLTLPATSASSATQAMMELVKAGLTLDEAMSAAKGTLQFAAAASISEAEAAEYAAAALNMFSLEGEKAIKVADLYAAAANSSAVSATDIAMSVKQAGSVFSSFQGAVVGGEEALEDLTVAITILGNAGIKSSDAGTSLKMSLLMLASPSEKAKGLMKDLARYAGETGDVAYTASGQMRSYEEILRITATATASMTDEQKNFYLGTVFGADAVKAIIPLLAAGADEWKKTEEAITAGGAAQAMAEAKMKGLNGAVAGLQSQVETLLTNAMLPLLPIFTEWVQKAAELAQTLATKAGPAATALAGSILELTTFLSGNSEELQNMVAAVTGIAAAYAAWKITAVVTALQVQIVTLAAANGGLVAHASAVAAATAPYAVFAAAIGAAVLVHQRTNAEVTKQGQALLGTKQFWIDSSKAVEDYTKRQNTAGVSVQAAANTVSILRDRLVEQMEAQAKLDLTNPKMFLEEKRQSAELTQQLAQGLKDATDNYNLLAEAEINSAAAGMTGSEAAEAQQANLFAVGEAATLTGEKLREYAEALAEIYEQGGQALGAYVETEVGFHAELEASTEEHTAKIAELMQAKAEATTEKEKAAIDEQIAAAETGYSEKLASQAAAYAQEQAAQNAHLGQMLADYTATQVALGNITSEQGNMIMGELETRFGSMKDTSASTFVEMTSQIDNWAASGSEDATNLGGALLNTRDDAVATKEKMDALATKYEAELIQNFKDGKIDAEQLADALKKIPARVSSIVDVRIDVSGGAPRSTGSAYTGGAPLKRAAGGYTPAGKTTLVGEEGPELVVFDEPGEVIPADESRRMLNAGMAGGGRTGGSSGGGRGVAGKVNSSIGAKLAEIAEEAGRKIIEIEREVQERLQEIDEESAKKRLEATRELYEEMKLSREETVADFESNDLDFFNKDNSDEDKKNIKRREMLEKQYLERITAAQNEARAIAEGGDAELAKETLAIKTKAAQDQMNLDKSMMEAQDQTGKKQQKDLRKEYDEAVAARQAQTDTEIAIAQAGAQQRIADEQAVKDEVVANADEKIADVVAKAEHEKVQLINKAVEATTGIKNAHSGATQHVVSGFKIQEEAANDATEAIERYNAEIASTPPVGSGGSSGGDSGGGGTGAGDQIAGGGSWITEGRQTITVGDNPSGREMVTVTPIGSAGVTHMGRSGGAMAGGGQIVTNSGGQRIATGGGTLSHPSGNMMDLINDLPQINAAIAEIIKFAEQIPGNGRPAFLQKYADALRLTGEAFKAIAELRTTIQGGGTQPLEPAAVLKLIDEAQMIAKWIQSSVKDAGVAPDQISRYADGVSAGVELVQTVAELRKSMQDLPPPVGAAIIYELAQESQDILVALNSVLIIASGRQREGFEQYEELVSQSVDILSNIIDLRDKIKGPLSPIPRFAIEQLVSDAAFITANVRNRLLAVTEEQVAALELYANAASAAVGILSGVAQLREQIGTEELGGLPNFVIDQLAADAAYITGKINQYLVPVTEEMQQGIERYAASAGSAVDILKGVMDLRKELTANLPPISFLFISQLAETAKLITEIVQRQLLPLTVEQSEQFQQYASAVNDAISVLNGVNELRGSLEEVAPPIDLAMVYTLANEALGILYQVQNLLLPITEEQSEAFSNYAGAISDSVGILSDVSNLRKELTEQHSPINLEYVRKLAQDAMRITQIVRSVLVPSTEEGNEQLSRYADLVASSVGIISDVLSLSGNMFTDYVSPTDDQINIIAEDARRITTKMMEAAAVWSTEGLEAGLMYADTVGKTFTAFKDGLLFFDALKSGDFELDIADLEKFEQGTLSTIETMRRLGEMAVTIPTANIEALERITAALSAQAEALIRLNAVPFDDLAAMGSGFGDASRSMLSGVGGTTISFGPVTIYADGGTDGVALADMFIGRINEKLNARRN